MEYKIIQGNLSLIDDSKEMLEKYLKKLGYKNVVFNESFDSGSLYKDLTLIIQPKLKDDYKYDPTLTRECRLFTREGEERYLEGGYQDDMYVFTFDGYSVQRIIVELNGKEFTLGYYYKERNTIHCPYLIKSALESMIADIDKNKFCKFFFEKIMDWMKNNKVKKIDNSGLAVKYFVNGFMKHGEKRIKNIDDTIKENKRNIDHYTRSIVDMMDGVKRCGLEREGLRKYLDFNKKKLFENVKEIKKLKYVSNVAFDANGIVVSVGKAYIKYRGKRYYIGDFDIIIKVNNVGVVNKDPVKDAKTKSVYHHPHIDEEVICFGEKRRDDIYRFLHTCEFKKLVFLCYLFLKDYTEDDKYISMERWVEAGREVDDKGKIVKKQKKTEEKKEEKKEEEELPTHVNRVLGVATETASAGETVAIPTEYGTITDDRVGTDAVERIRRVMGTVTPRFIDDDDVEDEDE